MALIGPVIAMVMLATLYVLMRRSARAVSSAGPTTAEPAEPKPTGSAATSPAATSPTVAPAPPPPTRLTDCGPDDYGLLATAAVARTYADALLVKEHLRSAGIRSTLANAPDGQVRVLVFGDEVVRARRLVG